jgi:hypothetical protein
MAMPEWKDSRREELLTDPAILNSIRGVLHQRGVPRQDIEDRLQQVLEEAWISPGLPLHDPEEARLYLCGMARFKAIDDAHQRERRPESIDWLPANERVAQAVPIEERELAETLLQRLAEKYPRTLSWFVRSEVHDEGFAEIAQSAQLSPGYIRHEVADIRRTARQMAKALGVALAVLLAIVFGMRRWRMPGQPEPIARRPVPHTHQLAPLDAGALRFRANNWCDVEAWQACADDLDAANALDPAGETDELRELRETARDQLAKLKPPTHREDKPPLPRPTNNKPPVH